MHATPVTIDRGTNPPALPHARNRSRERSVALRAAVLIAALAATSIAARSSSTPIGDAELKAASGGRTVRVGALSGNRRAADVPLEIYVAQVVAGEGEPDGADAAQQALAVAIRTYALANAGRHRRDGFDLCDTTHCQVPRAATAVSRRAASATAGQVLMYNGAPAEVFYSASCGGRSESASAVWPGADYPYLRSVRDDVHSDDAAWVVDLSLDEIRQILRRAGFEGGRLRDVRIDERSASGRASRLRLVGLQPEVVAGEQFRAAIGAGRLRSTAFTIQKRGSTMRFTGRGFGHGVGMCVIGAGRLARRGDGASSILSRYFPGLTLARLEAGRVEPLAARENERVAERPRASPAAGASAVAMLTADVPPSSTVAASELQRLATQAYHELSRTLGTSGAPISIRLHDSLESFRLATGQPWWVGAVSSGTSIDLAPAAVLALRDGLDVTVRTAVAGLLLSQPLSGRPVWVRVGAARYFARGEAPSGGRSERLRCPADAELTLAISAAAQREAEVRAEACFARAYAQSGDWRSVR